VKKVVSVTYRNEEERITKLLILDVRLVQKTRTNTWKTQC